MAAVTILRDELPELKIRVVNVVDLFKLESNHKHPHGLSDSEYNALFTTDKPVIFAFHGYPTLIHELTYRRDNQNVSVHGYHNSIRYESSERNRPFQPCKRCYHAPSTVRKPRFLPDSENERQTGRTQTVHRRIRTGYRRSS